MAAVKKDHNRCLVAFNTEETSLSPPTYLSSFRVIRYKLIDSNVMWQLVSDFEGEVIGLQFGNDN
jgi:hypothetical protein